MIASDYDKGFRLRELHALFLSEFDRCAHDNAVRLLKQIAVESGGDRIPSVPEVPTADAKVRLEYWRQMYDRARALKLMDRAMELLEHMRNEDGQRRVAA